VVDVGVIATEVQDRPRHVPEEHHGVAGPSTRCGRVKADPTQMHQLFTNLCVNARDAMPEGGVLA
jgi:signal transduction histidine kinase